jgi:hypothetical protein
MKTTCSMDPRLKPNEDELKVALEDDNDPFQGSVNR